MCIFLQTFNFLLVLIAVSQTLSVVRGNECIWISNNHVKLICLVLNIVVDENYDGKKSTLHCIKRSSKKLITTTFNVLIAVIVFSFEESNLRPDITPQPPWIISLIGAGVTPFAYLEIGRAMIEQFQHMPDVLCVLNHEVQFHVEFAAHQLQSETNKD